MTPKNQSDIINEQNLWQKIKKQVEENSSLLSVLELKSMACEDYCQKLKEESHVLVQYQTEPSKSSTTEFHTSDDHFRNPCLINMSSSQK